MAQSKFKPSKREIRLLSRISFLIYSAGAVVYAVSCYPAASIKLCKRKKVVSTNIMQFDEFEYDFACRRKDVHLCFIMSPGKMIFAVLEL